MGCTPNVRFSGGAPVTSYIAPDADALRKMTIVREMDARSKVKPIPPLGVGFHAAAAI